MLTYAQKARIIAAKGTLDLEEIEEGDVFRFIRDKFIYMVSYGTHSWQIQISQKEMVELPELAGGTLVTNATLTDAHKILLEATHHEEGLLIILDDQYYTLHMDLISTYDGGEKESKQDEDVDKKFNYSAR